MAYIFYVSAGRLPQPNFILFPLLNVVVLGVGSRTSHIMLDEPKLCICPDICKYVCWENWIYTSPRICGYISTITRAPPIYVLSFAHIRYISAMYMVHSENDAIHILRYAHQCFYLVSIVTFCETHTIFHDILLPWVGREKVPQNVRQWKKQRNNITINGTLVLSYI